MLLEEDAEGRKRAFPFSAKVCYKIAAQRIRTDDARRSAYARVDQRLSHNGVFEPQAQAMANDA